LALCWFTLIQDIALDEHTLTDSRPNKKAATLHLLGGFHLVGADGEPIGLSANKTRMMLAFLAVPANATHTREKLAALLWGDRGEDQARGSLRSALSEIRRALGKDALTDDNGAVGLRQNYLTTDYDILVSMRKSDAEVKDFSTIYAGEFLAGHEIESDEYQVWLRAMRSAAKEAAMDLFEAGAARFQAKGDTKRAIELMRTSLSIEPLRETTHRTIMELYAANGEKAMALAQFRTCCELLMHELDSQPDERTRSLADQISLGDGALTARLLSQVSSQNSPPASAATSEDAKRLSIAILPFVNMSGDAEQNFFVDGIVEDITTDLALVSGIHVAAHSATLNLRGSTSKPSEKAADIGVRYLVEGSMRKSGEDIRISAQLVDAKTERLEWAERFDRKLENIFKLQSEIASSIVGALKANLPLPERSGSTARTTSNVDAYQSYLRGRAMLRDLSQHSLGTALKLFEHAILLDPNYAQAFASLGLGHVLMVMHYGGKQSDLDLAMENTAKAMHLNPQLADAYVARGHTLTQLRKHDEAEREFDKAIALSPNTTDGYFYKGLMYMGLMNDHELAYQNLKKAHDLDDQDLQTGMMLNLCLHAQQRNDDVRKLSQKMMATAARRLANSVHDLSATYIMAISLFHLGRVDEAQQWMQATAAFGLDDARNAYNLACLASQLGDLENALIYLEKMLEIGCSTGKIYWVKHTDPDLVKLRNDARFDALLAKFGH
jgi:TolB-like protein/Tfp pilus assembly protein PilF